MIIPDIVYACALIVSLLFHLSKNSTRFSTPEIKGRANVCIVCTQKPQNLQIKAINNPLFLFSFLLVSMQIGKKCYNRQELNDRHDFQSAPSVQEDNVQQMIRRYLEQNYLIFRKRKMYFRVKIDCFKRKIKQQRKTEF